MRLWVGRVGAAAAGPQGSPLGTTSALPQRKDSGGGRGRTEAALEVDWERGFGCVWSGSPSPCQAAPRDSSRLAFREGLVWRELHLMR